MNRPSRIAQLLLVSAATSLLVGCSPMRVSLKSGSVDFLKQERQVNVEYSYDGMRVGKYVQEKDYLDKRTGDLNAKEAGRGDQWRRAWVDDRTRRFQPHFEELINKQFDGSAYPIQFGNFKDAKYTLVFKTTLTEAGWNIGISARPAFIDGDVTFVESRNRVNSLAVISVIRAPGMDAWGLDFDTGSRLQESYAMAGKGVGKLIRKKLK